MNGDKTSPYGTLESGPDEKAGVEVGGGDKAAAARDPKARKEAEPGITPSDQPDPAEEEEAQSPTSPKAAPPDVHPS